MASDPCMACGEKDSNSFVCYACYNFYDCPSCEDSGICPCCVRKCSDCRRNWICELCEYHCDCNGGHCERSVCADCVSIIENCFACSIKLETPWYTVCARHIEVPEGLQAPERRGSGTRCVRAPFTASCRARMSIYNSIHRAWYPENQCTGSWCQEFKDESYYRDGGTVLITHSLYTKKA